MAELRRLREVGGSGWQSSIERAPQSPGLPQRWLRRWVSVVIGSLETQWLDGTGSSVSDTNGQKFGGEGGGLRDDDPA